MRESGGGFDAIIDDGSHRNSHIMKTFDALWPTLQPGGVYFMEDLQVGRATDPKYTSENYEDTGGVRVVSDVMQSWTEQLLIQYPPPKLRNGAPMHAKDGTLIVDEGSWQKTKSNLRAIQLRKEHPLPPDIAFVHCQAEACAIGKQMAHRERQRDCKNAKLGQ